MLRLPPSSPRTDTLLPYTTLFRSACAADITWRVPTSVPAGSPFYQNFLERFASNIKTMTSGRVEIQPFGAGVIVPALKVFDAVQDGVVDGQIGRAHV